MRTCARCQQDRLSDQMSRSTGATKGWCLYCVEASKNTLNPPRVCVKCKETRLYDQMSRSTGATKGWCLTCTATANFPRVVTHKPKDYSERLSPEALVQFRTQRGLTQTEFAAALKVSVPAVSKWECGKTPIPPIVPLAMSAFIAGLPPYK